jgi:hypothetical protein
MAGWFRRPKQMPETHVDPDEVKALLPASVRGPEANRFTPLGSDFDGGDESSDEDIEFLTSLVESVERERAVPALPAPRPAPPPARKPPIQRVAPAPGMDVFTDANHLELFRGMRADDPEPRNANIKVDDVELDDLLEELSTTMAALRRRKAA